MANQQEKPYENEGSGSTFPHFLKQSLFRHYVLMGLGKMGRGGLEAVRKVGGVGV